jgi:nucleoside-diphosphate-sugar epimerase
MDLPDVGLKEMRLSHLSTFPAFNFMKCDLTDHTRIKKALTLRHIETVFHFAGQGKGEGEQSVFSYLYHNVTGTLNFLELIKDASIPYVVLPKIELEKDNSFYQASILARESFLEVYRKNHHMKIFNIAAENVFGNYCHARGDIFDFANKIKSGDVIYLKQRGSQAKRYVYIDELTQQIATFMEDKKDFESPQGYVLTQIELLQYLEDALMQHAQIVWGKEESFANATLSKNVDEQREDEFKNLLNLSNIGENFI